MTRPLTLVLVTPTTGYIGELKSGAALTTALVEGDGGHASVFESRIRPSRILERPYAVELVRMAMNTPQGPQVITQRQVQPILGLLSIESVPVADDAIVIGLGKLSPDERRELERGVADVDDLRAKAGARRAGLIVQ
jgi:hypothetical protein